MADVHLRVGWGPGHPLDTDDLETGWPDWRLRPLNELQAVVGRHGIAPGDHVILHGDWPAALARAWWTVRFAGVASVGVSRAPSPDLPLPPPVDFSAPCRPELAVRADEIDPAVVTIADVRTEAEFRGEVSGYRSLLAKGRIPGAVHAGSIPDDRWMSPDEVLAQWSAAGLLDVDPARIVFVCGGGWRSSLACLYAHELGLRDVRHFPGGWFEWSTRFVPDPDAGPPTPGLRQAPTGRPVEQG